MIKYVKHVRFAIAKLAFWHEALLCGIGHQNGWKKSRPFWALTKLWFTWYGLGGYNVVNPPINTAQIRCDGMQHMLKHLILPCVFASKIKVALFYWYLHYIWMLLESEEPWQSACLFVFFLSCMCFHCIFPIETHVWWIFHGISHMDSRYCFCFDICAHAEVFLVVIYDMINDIVNDHSL